MRAGGRRRRREAAGLDITAFLNLIVVLVPFLLSTAVFSRLSILELNLPAGVSAFENLKGEIELEVTIRRDGLELSDRMGAFRERIENTSKGYNFAMLTELMKALKARFPNKAEVTILAEPDTSYDLVVQTMDAVRATKNESGTMIELFPAISIGDAPLAKRAETPQKTEKAS